jgi:Polyketide cyclase / dehydrase and lipid transport
MMPLTHSASITVARPPGEVYALVADITRMGEYSPICEACWWDEGDGPRVGAHFTGRNVLPERTWETRSEVVAADEGREFAWVVGPDIARWGYTFTEVAEGTMVTESWEFLDGGHTLFEARFGDDAGAQIADRYEKAVTGIPQTLAAIKRAAEAEASR